MAELSPAAILADARRRRRAGDAAAAARALAALAPRVAGAWGVHFELGLAQAALGEADAAIAALTRAVALNPASMLARHALRDQRLLHDAGADDPSLGAALADQALVAAIDRFLSGQAAALAGFGLDPEDAAAACVIAEVGDRIGRYDSVAEVLRRALRAAPGHAPARYRLAIACHRTDRDEEALALARALPASRARDALRGAVLLALGREAEAEAVLAGVAATRADAGAHLAHGHALRALGRGEDARAAYRAAIELAPELGQAWWSIADLKTGGFSAADRETLRALVARPDVDALSRSYLHFALGHAEEAAGAFAAAFSHYRAANVLRRAIEPYDAAPHDRLVAAALTALGEAPPPIEDRPGPVFVVGMPRSGTSLVEQILASHSAIEGLGELPDLGLVARMPAPAGDVYQRRIAARRHTERPIVVDKFPGNWLHLALIRRILPHARVIDVRRDPRDCCLSLYAQAFAAGQGYSYDLADLAHRYDRYLAVLDAAAPDPRVMTVRYEALVDAPERETRRMLAHLGVAFEPACLAFHTNPRAVRTASSEQVRRPLHRGAIGRWRRFEAELAPLIVAFSPRVRDEMQRAARHNHNM